MRTRSQMRHVQAVGRYRNIGGAKTQFGASYNSHIPKREAGNFRAYGPFFPLFPLAWASLPYLISLNFWCWYTPRYLLNPAHPYLHMYLVSERIYYLVCCHCCLPPNRMFCYSWRLKLSPSRQATTTRTRSVTIQTKNFSKKGEERLSLKWLQYAKKH